MMCWHCDKELEFNFQTEDLLKFYHCANCDKWYEMFKEKAKVNGAVPIRFYELESHPEISRGVSLSA